MQNLNLEHSVSTLTMKTCSQDGLWA